MSLRFDGKADRLNKIRESKETQNENVSKIV